MALSSFIQNFCRIGPQNNNAPTLWSFKGTDAVTAVDAEGYFNAVANRVKVGDIIFYYKTDATVAAGMFVVLSNTRDLAASPPVSGVVDVANVSTLQTAIDSD